MGRRTRTRTHADISTPETTQRFIGGGQFNWTPYSTEHQSLQLTLIGGVDIANVLDELYAPANLQLEQTLPLPGVSTTQTTHDQYINYSVNLIHHYTGLSWLDATTSVGFVRERRDLLNPFTVSQNVIAGVNNPSIGTVQTNIYNRTAQRDQSLYAQEQILTLVAAALLHRRGHGRAHDERRRHQQVLLLSALCRRLSDPAVPQLPR